MSCGAKNEHNDVCGETYTCAACNLGDNVGRLHGRIAQLERALKTAREALVLGICVYGEPCEDRENSVGWIRMEESLAEIKAVLGEK